RAGLRLPLCFRENGASPVRKRECPPCLLILVNASRRRETIRNDKLDGGKTLGGLREGAVRQCMVAPPFGCGVSVTARNQLALSGKAALHELRLLYCAQMQQFF